MEFLQHGLYQQVALNSQKKWPPNTLASLSLVISVASEGD